MRPVTWNLRLAPRRELRLALLAAMETCWVYSIVAFMAVEMRFERALSPLALFAAYWLALVVGRVLPRLKQRWIILQLLAVAVAVVAMVAAARIELYPHMAWNDLAWLPRYVGALVSFVKNLTAEHLAAAAVLYMFVRGLGFAQRPLTLWFVGFQFRLGVLIFFVLFLIAGFFESFRVTQARSFDTSLWIFVYFFLSLLAVALARIDEMESDARLGLRWAITLVTAVALVLFLGLGVLQFLTLDVAEAALRLFAPLAVLLGIVLLLVAIPAAILAGWIADFLRPIFERLGKLFEEIQQLVPREATEAVEQVLTVNPLTTLLASLFQILLVLSVFLGVGYLLARALHRRMSEIEAETYLCESIGTEEDVERARRAGLAKKKSRQTARHIAAETIRRIYAALVARAGDAGLPRQVAETPYEYLPRLQHTWQEPGDDIRTITEAYVAVHYGEHDATPDEVSRVRAAWMRVEQLIHAAKRNTQHAKRDT
jgi:ABC-type multidrug transport system fused ATPase/permease subunit